MLSSTHFARLSGLLLGLHLAALPVLGAGRVELELLTEAHVPITSQQEWVRRLGRAGIDSVRIRSAGQLDSVRVAIDIRGTESSPTYVVTGVITARDELVLPGGRRFKASEAGQVAGWVDDLARLGPVDRRPTKVAFGLGPSQLQQVHDELSQPLSGSTKGKGRSEIVQSIARQLTIPLRYGRVLPETIGTDEMAEELSGISCGTALAYALRAPGLCLVPRPTARGVELEIASAEPNLEAWPIGWEPEKSDRDILPGMYEFLNVQLDGVATTKVLEAIGERLQVPVLLDHNAMARHGVNPETAYVSFPQGRTTYSLLLRKALFQARLKSELRVDEAGKPLFWITTIKPL